jgi:hypothetical protein
VANNGDNTVTKLRSSDGVVLGTFPAGIFPAEMVFDGANIWVTNQNSTQLVELRASDGALLGTFLPGGFPSHLAFDGTNVWATGVGSGLGKL